MKLPKMTQERLAEKFTAEQIVNYAGITAFAYAAAVEKIQDSAEALNTPLGSFVRHYLYNEVIPALPHTDTDSGTLISGFFNEYANNPKPIADLTPNGSDVMREVVAPLTVRALQAGLPHTDAAFVFAAWRRYFMGHDRTLSMIDVQDDMARDLKTRISVSEEGDPAFGLVAIEKVFGPSLFLIDEFKNSLRKRIDIIHANGIMDGVAQHMPRPTFKVVTNAPV